MKGEAKENETKSVKHVRKNWKGNDSGRQDGKESKRLKISVGGSRETINIIK